MGTRHPPPNRMVAARRSRRSSKGVRGGQSNRTSEGSRIRYGLGFGRTPRSSVGTSMVISIFQEMQYCEL